MNVGRMGGGVVAGEYISVTEFDDDTRGKFSAEPEYAEIIGGADVSAKVSS